MGVGERFVILYSRYPRKEGKTRGRKVYEKLLRDGVDPSVLELALTNYLALLVKEKREKKYVKHFDTWLRNYEDYLETDPDGGGNKTLAQRVIAGEI